MRPTSRLKLVVLDFAIRNASCDLQNDDKVLRFFCCIALNWLVQGQLSQKSLPCAINGIFYNVPQKKHMISEI